MKIKINGNDKEIDDGETVASLIKLLNLPPGPVAAQVNEEIIHRDEYANHTINDGDIIEIFTMLGGG